jgi:hypothetical protein
LLSESANITIWDVMKLGVPLRNLELRSPSTAGDEIGNMISEPVVAGNGSFTPQLSGDPPHSAGLTLCELSPRNRLHFRLVDLQLSLADGYPGTDFEHITDSGHSNIDSL